MNIGGDRGKSRWRDGVEERGWADIRQQRTMVCAVVVTDTSRDGDANAGNRGGGVCSVL